MKKKTVFVTGLKYVFLSLLALVVLIPIYYLVVSGHKWENAHYDLRRRRVCGPPQ